MRFDLFFEFANPPHLARDEAAVYEDTLAAVELADRLGFGCAWLVEHHFMRGYSHSPKPELALAALARTTRRIRLGLGVIPLPYHHPVHVAERVSVLDLLSGGRLEVGLGRGFSPREYRAFGVEMADSRTLAQEALDVLRLSFAREPVTYAGRHVRLEDVDLLPHPLQRPHPPLWSAVVSPTTLAWAARENLGMLAGPFKPWFMVRHDISAFRAACPPPARVGMTVGILCLEDGARARAEARRAFTWFYQELFKTTLPVLEGLYPTYEHFRELGRFRQLLKLGINLPMLETFGLVVVGTPEECVRQLRKYQAAGVTHLLCAVGAGAVEAALVEESLHCLARSVLPAFRAEPAAAENPL